MRSPRPAGSLAPMSERAGEDEKDRHVSGSWRGEGSLPLVPTELLPHLRRARDLMDRNFAEELDLNAVAAAAGISRCGTPQ